MSLDVYLIADKPVPKSGPRTGIFIRRDGATVEITREEWDALRPGVVPVVSLAGLDEDTTNVVYEANITHNLGAMAREAKLYGVLWRPDENGYERAGDLVEPLERGLATLRAKPARFKKLNPKNGWGDYDGLVAFVDAYLAACKARPDAKVEVSR